MLPSLKLENGLLSKCSLFALCWSVRGDVPGRNKAPRPRARLLQDVKKNVVRRIVVQVRYSSPFCDPPLLDGQQDYDPLALEVQSSEVSCWAAF